MWIVTAKYTSFAIELHKYIDKSVSQFIKDKMFNFLECMGLAKITK